MSSSKQIPLQAEGDMKRDARIVRNVVLTAVLLAVFLQVQIFYGLVKLSIVSSNNIPILSSDDMLSDSKRIGISASDQKRDFGRIQLNQKFHNVSSIVAASNFTRKDKKKLSLWPRGYAHYPFVQFSAYRESQRVFFVVGITSKVLRDFDLPVYKCQWQKTSNSSDPSNPSSVTDANMIYVYFDQMPRIYVVAIVNCTFKEDVGGDGEGGSLFMSVSTGPHHGDTEEVLALEEHKGEAKEAALGAGDDDHSLPLKFAFCSPPIYGNIKADWLLHWLVYHHYIWRESVHFFFYNVGGITDTIRQLILPFLDKGLITILDVEDEKKYPSWYFNQLLFINDCLHRTRYLSSWTFFHDFDEFLAISSPNITLDNLLDQHKNAPFLTFGSVRASLWMCAETPPDSSDWPLQRMLWVEKQPYCYVPDQDPWLCIHGEGARKYAVNPRKVFASGVHRTAIPAEGGVNLNVSIAKLIHYPGTLSNSTSLCSSSFNVSTPLQVLHQISPSTQIYVRDDYISMEMRKARDFYAKWQVGSSI